MKTQTLFNGLFKWILLFLLLFGFSQNALADHIIGADITYRFVAEVSPGVNRYEFLMVLFRDCDSGGAPLDAQAPIGYYRGSLNDAVLIDSDEINLQSVVPVPPDIPECASSTPTACVQKGTYRFTKDLDVLAGDSWIVVYQRCCRTAGIKNVEDSDDYGGTYLVEITPLAQALQNSSPTFVNQPPSFICKRFSLDYDHSASDIDGDSLVYEFCSPLHGGGRNFGGGNCVRPTPNPPCPPPYDIVPIEPPFSVQAPMGGVPLIRVDRQTGIFSGDPTQLGNFVVGVCVREYRNGQYLGSVLRDFQFTVVDCERKFRPATEFTRVIGYQEFEIDRCAEIPIFVRNESTTHPTLKEWRWEIYLSPIDTFFSDEWDLDLPIPDFGTYTGWLFLNEGFDCPDSARVVINAFPGVTTSADFDYDLCERGEVSFTNNTFTGAMGGVAEYLWEFGTPNEDSAFVGEPNFQFPDPDFYQTRLVVTDADGCKDTALLLVDWFPRLLPDTFVAAPIRQCEPGDGIVLDFLDSLGLQVQYEWDLGDSTFSTDAAPIHDYAIGSYDVSFTITSFEGCTASQTFENLIEISPNPTANFFFSPNAASNIQPTIKFENASSSNVSLWEWSFGEEGSSNLPNPVYAFRDTGLQTVTLLVETQNGCTDSTSQRLDVVPLVQLYIPNVIRTSDQDNLANEQFRPLGILPGYQAYQMSIYDRWGSLIFQTNDPEMAWFGRYAGSDKFVPTGVYVYHIELVGPRGERYEFKDSLTVLAN